MSIFVYIIVAYQCIVGDHWGDILYAAIILNQQKYMYLNPTINSEIERLKQIVNTRSTLDYHLYYLFV